MMSEPESNALERLSAVMDGEADEAALREVCGSWQAQASCRAAWHAYHLIGDVLRSEDLAAKAGRGSALLGAVRERLADEPTLLVPPARPATRWRSIMPAAAVAAGFVAVGGAVLVLQAPPPSAPLALSAPAQDLRAVAATRAASVAGVPAVSGPMVRDARLQQYLVAHKQFGGSTALGVSSGFLRSATVEAPAR